MEKRRELTIDRATQILSSRPEITEAGVFSGIRIGNISFFKKDKVTPHTWKESGDRYAIVNLQAMSSYHADQAMELLEAGDAQGATNKNFTINLSVEEAKELVGSLATATVEFTNIINNDGIEILVARKMQVNTVKKAVANNRFKTVKAEAPGVEA